jgi:hypothetical protein
VSDDLLHRATRALRSATESQPLQLEHGLQRLERARGPALARRRNFSTWAITLAAMFVGVGAWANATGRIDWFQPTPTPSVPAAPPRPMQPPAPSRPRAPSSPAAAVPEADAPEADAPEPATSPSSIAVTPGSRARPRAAALPSVAVRAPLAAPVLSAPTSVGSDPDALYAVAHAAHFAGTDYRAALAAWDRYLQAAGPGHRLLLEGRFNRAIALYHLGEKDAARRALIPFAEGDYGGYRREDARHLLDALDQRR